MRKGSCGHSCRAMLRDEIVMGGEARRGARDDRFDVADKARQLLAAQLIGHRVIAARHDILPRQHLEPADFDEQLVALRSEEHTSELQSLMRNSYAVFCLKKKTQTST